jgi:diguanylate cyclase (GGDEF)-like protein
MVDIDHFHKFADRYGYNVADGILISVAGVLKKSLRKSDLIARFGESQFVIVLPNSDLEQCVSSGEKVRKNIIGTSMPQLERERITISIGAVSHPETGAQSPIELVRRANETLAEAKRNGRNRVMAA